MGKIKLEGNPPYALPMMQTVTARATNKIGQTQTNELIHNPAGYHHNVVHSVSFNVA